MIAIDTTTTCDCVLYVCVYVRECGCVRERDEKSRGQGATAREGGREGREGRREWRREIEGKRIVESVCVSLERVSECLIRQSE